MRGIWKWSISFHSVRSMEHPYRSQSYFYSPFSPPSVSEQENTAPGASSDNEFPDDEVLMVLRQRASRYREQLRY